jgi:competence protein ComEC
VNDIYSKIDVMNGVERQDADFTVYYLDVGQSDCTIITCDDMTMIIDTGSKFRNIEIKSALFTLGIKQIDYLVITHPHDDHMSNASEIIENYDVKNILMPKISADNQVDSPIYSTLINTIAKYDVNPLSVTSGDNFQLGNASVQVVAPIKQNKNLNNMSLVLKISYGETAFLFQGDVEKTVENDVLSNDIDISADVIKIGHHGSSSSTTEEFIKEINPDIAVISCGYKNQYGHPHKSTLDTLEENNVLTYRTDILGNIVFYSDGNTIFTTKDYKLNKK